MDQHSSEHARDDRQQAAEAASASPALPGRRTRRSRWRYAELLRARWTLLGALGTLAVGAFLKLTSEVNEGELDGFDRALLERVVQLRVPSFNGAAVDLTALGSVTVMTLIVVIALVFFLLSRDLHSVAQLSIASIGAGICSTLLKQVLERERPAAVTRLVHVASFSYPSGHSLVSACVYLTLAILVSRYMPTRTGRVLVFALALGLAAMIGASRAYLGVHYPSDIMAGLTLGAGWALLVSAVFSYARAKVA